MITSTTDRGSVLVARRPVGFGSGNPERFLVVQTSDLNDVLSSTVVIPLDAVHPRYSSDVFAVRLGAKESGSGACVALVDLIQAVPRDRFQPGVVGAASDATMARIEEALRLLLELP